VLCFPVPTPAGHSRPQNRVIQITNRNGAPAFNPNIRPNSVVLFSRGVLVEASVYTITNLGNTALNLTGSPKVRLSRANTAEFTITFQAVSPVDDGDHHTFPIRFAPSVTGLLSAAVSITNNTNSSPFTFDIQGTGTADGGKVGGGGGCGASVGGAFTPVDRTILLAPLLVMSSAAAAAGLFLLFRRRQAS
jgi:hypothetical protein